MACVIVMPRLIMPRLIMPCLGLFFSSVVVAFVPRLIMPMPLMTRLGPMIMLPRGPEILPERPLRRQKPQLLGGGGARQRPVQPRRHLRPDPDHQTCLLQPRRL